MNPKTRWLQGNRVIASSLLPLLLAGCATSRQKTGVTISASSHCPTSASDLGTIGIICTNTLPGFTIQRPIAKSELADRWAINCSKVGDPFMAVPYLNVFVGLPLFVGGGAAGSAAGGLAGVSTTTIARTDSAVTKSTQELNLRETFRLCVATALEEQGGRTVIVEKPFPPGDRKELTQMSCLMASTLAWLPTGVSRAEYLAGQGAETVLELRLIHPGLRGEGTVNPSLAFCVQVHAQLNDVSSGRELAGCTLQYRSESHKYSQWGANDAQLLREELTRFCRLTADAIGKQLLSAEIMSTSPSL
jgi:hypothetical protein